MWLKYLNQIDNLLKMRRILSKVDENNKYN